MKYGWFTELPLDAFTHVGDRKIRLHGAVQAVSDAVSDVGKAVTDIVAAPVTAIADVVNNAVSSTSDAVAKIGQGVSDVVHDVGTAVATNPILSTAAGAALIAAGVPPSAAVALLQANAGASPEQILKSAAVAGFIPEVSSSVAGATGSTAAGAAGANAVNQLISTGNVNPLGVLAGAAGSAADTAVTGATDSNLAGNVAGALTSGAVTGRPNTVGTITSGISGLTQDLIAQATAPEFDSDALANLLPSVAPGDDGGVTAVDSATGKTTTTYTADDGSTLTVDENGDVVNVTDATNTGLIVEPPTPTTPTAPVPPAPSVTPLKPTSTPFAFLPGAVTTPSANPDLAALLTLLGGGQQPVTAAPVQDPYAKIKSFQGDLFGGDISTDFLGAATGGSIDDLLKILKG